MVFGELKAGKSTCLNFLLGEDVLPSEDAACTVVVTELHYGETKKVHARVYKTICLSLPLTLTLTHSPLSLYHSLLSTQLKTVDSKTGEVCEQPLDLSKGKASDILANFLKEKSKTIFPPSPLF